MGNLGKFFLIASSGAVTDFGLFIFLNFFDVSVFLSNLISASVAVVLVYFLSKIFLYKSKYSKKEFVKFAAWYAFSIFMFSSLIAFIANETFLSSVISKLLVMPGSFTANYLMGEVILDD